MENGKQVTDIYGQLVFSDKVMRERLPKDVYKAVHKTIENGGSKPPKNKNNWWRSPKPEKGKRK